MIKKIIQNKAEINKEELKIKLLEYFKYIDRVYLYKLFNDFTDNYSKSMIRNVFKELNFKVEIKKDGKHIVKK